MALYRILVVDPQSSFAEILCEGLEKSGDYQAVAVSTGEEALRALREAEYHLVIVDVAVSDPGPAELIAAMRAVNPHLRIVLIPPFGQELDESLASLDIQGVLPKPFFISRLEGQIREFLQRRVKSAPPARAELIRDKEDEIRSLLGDLCRDVSADMAALMCRGEMVVYLGSSDERGTILSRLMRECFDLSARLATFLHEAEPRFELTCYVGKVSSLYVLMFGQDLALVAVPGAHIPAGAIHLSIKRTVEGLSALLADMSPHQ